MKLTLILFYLSMLLSARSSEYQSEVAFVTSFNGTLSVLDVPLNGSEGVKREWRPSWVGEKSFIDVTDGLECVCLRHQ